MRSNGLGLQWPVKLATCHFLCGSAFQVGRVGLVQVAVVGRRSDLNLLVSILVFFFFDFVFGELLHDPGSDGIAPDVDGGSAPIPAGGNQFM